MTAKVIVRALPPIWGAPNPSPFVIKLLTWLRMAGIEHELVALRSPPRSSTGKVPYIELPGGEIVSDSGRIMERLSADRGIDLDADLDEVQRAHARMLACTIEDHLYFVGLYERFATPEGFAHVRRDYFGHLPLILRWLAPVLIRRRALANLHGQGMGRLARKDVAEAGRRDVRALAAFLGNKKFFLGDAPTNVDATATGFLWAMSSHPWDSAIRASVEKEPALVAYLERMRGKYWSDFGR